jgi:lysozyme
MNISNNCIQLLKHYEGCRLEAYKCSAGIWTIGYGNTFHADGRPVKQGDSITQQKAEELLPLILKKFAQAVFKRTAKMEQYEFDALVCFTYNVGIGAFDSSTLLKKIRKELPPAEIALEFHKWNKAKGKVLQGLVKRRAAEAWLYEKGEVRIF